MKDEMDHSQGTQAPPVINIYLLAIITTSYSIYYVNTLYNVYPCFSTLYCENRYMKGTTSLSGIWNSTAFKPPFHFFFTFRHFT